MRSVFTDEYTEFTRRIVAARKNAGVTQQQLADRIGKPQSFVSKYERGERRVDLVEFLAIADALGLDAGRFIRGLRASLKKKPRS